MRIVRLSFNQYIAYLSYPIKNHQETIKQIY